jgi:carboxyl-terminal processing protease
MRRFAKLFALVVASVTALLLTVRHGNEGIRVDGNSPLRAATRDAAGRYDLAQMKIFTNALGKVTEGYFDKNRFDPKRMLVGALDFVQRDVAEILIDRAPERDPKQVTVKVNGQQRTFSIEDVDAPWSVRSKLQDIFRFIQPNLQPVSEKEEGRRLVEIEMAATNGLLYTLDPHSVLLDVETYKDMRTQTQGKFGGLGIVIEMDKKNRITVKRPMPDTPAIRVGLKPKDHIVRINNESTMNMTLNEAVDRLRGDEDTNVDVYIERDGVVGSKKFTITRAIIRPPAIDPPARVLPVPAVPGQPVAKIGYFHMQHFSANSASDLADALQMFEKERVRGIIMDLRGNPGGLYEQAQKVADAFVKSGTLVSMVGVGETQPKSETATDSGHEPTVPLAVLVNQNSASASEIVAGAMKNLDRGVVIGEGTFGKGSVQILFDIPSPVPFGDKPEDDRLGLKLTTAQYLTPGDVSIQGVGVIPDIETVPMLVQKEGERSWIRLQSSAHKRREADFEWHLEHPSARRGEKPRETVSYLLAPKPSDKANHGDDEAGPDDDEDETGEASDDKPDDDKQDKNDFLIEFARDFLAQAKGVRRTEILAAAHPFLEKVRMAEDRKVGQALEKLGVDWAQGPTGGAEAVGPVASDLRLSLSSGEKAKIVAGETIKVVGQVKNFGTVAAYRVRAVLQSDNGVFDENEMVFGRIGPGETRTYELFVKVPTSSFTRTDVIRGTVFSQREGKTTPAELTLNIEGRLRPRFAYTYQTVDDVKGNRDGLVQRGEQVRELVTVKNIGLGRALHTEAVLRNGTGQEGILITAGRFDAKEMAPGESKTFSFIYEVGTAFHGDEYQLDLAVGDITLGESVTDKIKIKIAPDGPAPTPASGVVTAIHEGAPLRESAEDSALVIGRVPKGAAFKVTGQVRSQVSGEVRSATDGTANSGRPLAKAGDAGAFARVDLENGRAAFLAMSDVKEGGVARPEFVPVWQVTPPVLTVAAPTVVTSETVHVKGKALDDRMVRDIFIRVWNRDAKVPIKKVFYLANRPTGDRTRLEFSADVPLWPGSNMVQVFARESNEVQSLDTLVVLRKGQSVVAQPSPPADAPPAPLR